MSEQLRIPIEGMTCSSCVGHISHALRGFDAVDLMLGQDLDRERVDLARLGSSGVDLEVRTAIPFEERLGDLAAGGIAGADEKHPDRPVTDPDLVGHLDSCLGTAGTTGGLDRQRQIDELGVEPIEVRVLASDRGALLPEQRSEVLVDRASLQAQP